MADDTRDLQANSTSISDEIICYLFLEVLLEQSDAFRQMADWVRKGVIRHRWTNE